MRRTQLGKIVVYTFSAIIIVAVAYIIVMSIPYRKKTAGMKYYSSVKQAPPFRDKQALRNYCENAGFNTNVCVLVNYSIRSGSPRFFVYDFNKLKIVYRCRCAHGLGGGSTARKAVFSNSYGSRCSSLGKFVFSGIGSVHYKNCIRLRGLDESNDNAEKRGILIHSASIVTRFRWLPWIPLSKSCEGCFTITKGGLMKMHDILQKEKNKKILVYAYNNE